MIKRVVGCLSLFQSRALGFYEFCDHQKFWFRGDHWHKVLFTSFSIKSHFEVPSRSVFGKFALLDSKRAKIHRLRENTPKPETQSSRWVSWTSPMARSLSNLITVFLQELLDSALCGKIQFPPMSWTKKADLQVCRNWYKMLLPGPHQKAPD